MTKPTPQQLEQFYRRLTAKERAKLELGRWREDQEPDRLLRKHTPDSHLPEMNSYLREADTANHIVAALALWLGERLDAIAARNAIGAALRLRDMLADSVIMALQLDLPEPIIKSERDRRLAKQREERIPVAEAAELLVGEDLAGAKSGGQEKRIREAAAAGLLNIEKGEVLYGELMDWAGRQMPIIPEWGCEVAILPAEAANYIGRVNRFRERLLATVAVTRRGSGSDTPDVHRIAEALGEATAAGLSECRGTVLAIDEAVVQLETLDFDGDAIIHPETLARLEEVRDRIATMAEDMQRDGAPVELASAPDAAFLEMLRARFGV